MSLPPDDPRQILQANMMAMCEALAERIDGQAMILIWPDDLDGPIVTVHGNLPGAAAMLRAPPS